MVIGIITTAENITGKVIIQGLDIYHDCIAMVIFVMATDVRR